MRPELIADPCCFVCGPENGEGLQARFQCSEGKATGRYQPRDTHRGYAGIAHGGILAALLDEAMVYAAATLGYWVATAELTIRYQKPASTEEPLLITAEVTSHRRKLVECRAALIREDGTEVATATGKLLQGTAITGVEAEKLAAAQALRAAEDQRRATT